jgi:hypothetical protein
MSPAACFPMVILRKRKRKNDSAGDVNRLPLKKTGIKMMLKYTSGRRQSKAQILFSDSFPPAYTRARPGDAGPIGGPSQPLKFQFFLDSRDGIKYKAAGT